MRKSKKVKNFILKTVTWFMGRFGYCRHFQLTRLPGHQQSL